MAFPTPNGPSKEAPSPARLPHAPAMNNNAGNLSHSLERLSISTASSTALPASPQLPSPSRLGNRNMGNASPKGKAQPPQSPLRRSSSSMSIGARASTPTLHKKASMNSLHGGNGVTPSRPATSRRSSSAQFVNASVALTLKSPLSEIEDMEPPPPRHTAASIASTHFKSELDLHDKEDDARPTDTIVILHDDCYGHRYSRPRTTKASLSTIVERPERIHASILGVSVAYVRLGERHAEGQYPLHPSRDGSSIPSTPFRIRKTTRRIPLSSQAVTNVHGIKWMEELKIMCDNAEARLAMNGKELTRPQMTRSPDQDVPAKLHEGDLYLCSESLHAMEGALGAVCEGVDSVFQGSATGKGPHRSFVAIRPPGHHCSASYPSGFCWVNNVHVGISHAALTHGLTHAAIIDFDLHHGDGSQSIAWEHNKRATGLAKNALPWKKTSIGYFSLHDINSYPCEMGDEEKVKNASLCIENAHGQSVWNVHLQPWKSESEFWELYETKYSVLLEKTRNYLRNQTDRLRLAPNGPKPKAAIFLSAGFDASEWESSGMQRHKVNVPTEFYARLTKDVVKIAAEEGTAVDGRVISVLEGGYSDRALCSGVFSHLSGMASDTPMIQKETHYAGLGHEMGQKIGVFNGVQGIDEEPVSTTLQSYDPTWWSSPHLEQLEAVVNPAPPPPDTKKPRDISAPTFSSPTQSFIAKVNTSTPRRSPSGVSSNNSPKPLSSRSPSPPPPEVLWTVAAHELSKLLIPTDRQTGSCKPEDLSAEATRVRRDRQSIAIIPTSSTEQTEVTNQRMALRTRKAKPIIENSDEDSSRKAAAKANRRKTVAGATAISSEKDILPSTTPLPEPSYAKPTAQSSRRLSLASNTGSIASETPRPIEHHRAPSSGSIAAFQRSGTSHSVRPDSSMSSRAPSLPPVAPVIVKKTRAPAQPRSEPNKPIRARKRSPQNGEATAPVAQPAPEATQSRVSSGVVPRPTPPNTTATDIDNLTSGMNKVKISLITKSQREAREQAKASTQPSTTAPTKLKVKPAPKSTTARAQKPKVPSKSKPAIAVPPNEQSLSAHDSVKQSIPQADGPFDSAINQSEPTLQQDLKQSQITTGIDISPQTPQPIHVFGRPTISQPVPGLQTHQPPQISPITPAIKSTPNNQKSQSNGNISDVFIPYQPEGPTPVPISQQPVSDNSNTNGTSNGAVTQDTLQWLPPNTAVTPTPFKKGNAFPVFTATGPIPFGVRPTSQSSGTEGGTSSLGGSNGKVEVKEEESIWDVPETPRQ